MCVFLKDNWEMLLKIIGGVIVIGSFWKGLFEYGKQRQDKRAQQFLELRRSFRENKKFQEITLYLLGDNDFSEFTDNDKFEFMAFFEDIAFLMNSGLIKKEVAFYMFGYDAIAAWHNNNFWPKERRKDKYWSLLTDFVNQMKEAEAAFKYNRKKIKL